MPNFTLRRVINGWKDPPPLEGGVDTVDAALGEMVGKLYVERYFQEAAEGAWMN